MFNHQFLFNTAHIVKVRKRIEELEIRSFYPFFVLFTIITIVGVQINFSLTTKGLKKIVGDSINYTILQLNETIMKLLRRRSILSNGQRGFWQCIHIHIYCL